MSEATGPLDRFRRPEYTGENRCVPCTVFNLALSVVAAGGVALAVRSAAGSLAGLLVGGGLFALFAAAIYLRGYLVPGTPWITKTYFPDRVLRWFDKDPAALDGGVGPAVGQPVDEEGGPADGQAVGEDVAPADGQAVDVERTLRRAGAVTECDRADDLCLTDDFRADWRDRIADLRERDAAREELATVFGVAPARLSFEEHGSAFVAFLDDRRAGQWESRAARLADAAAAGALRERYPPWTDVDVYERSRVLDGLRAFLDACPACDGPVSLDQEVVESCCRSIDVFAVTCQDCGARLFEAERPG